MHSTVRVILCAVLLTPMTFAGTISAVNSSAALGANDYIDWGQLGADLTVVASPFGVTSNLGQSATVAGPGDFWSIQQGNTWGGNFAPTDNVLYSSAPGVFTITFLAPIRGAGLQFQSTSTGAFVPEITAFGAGDVNFGSVSSNGTSSNAGDGSAVFLGAMSTAQDILKLQFNVQMSQVDTDFAVNRLQILSAPDTAIPEPSTISMGVAGLLALAALRRRRN